MVLVPYVTRKIYEKQNSEANICKEGSPDQDFSLVNLEKISDDVNERVLTEIFEMVTTAIPLALDGGLR